MIEYSCIVILLCLCLSNGVAALGAQNRMHTKSDCGILSVSRDGTDEKTEAACREMAGCHQVMRRIV